MACSFWFLFQIIHGLVAWGNGGAGVAYAAHAGGFVAGVVIGLSCFVLLSMLFYDTGDYYDHPLMDTVTDVGKGAYLYISSTGGFYNKSIAWLHTFE